MVGGIAGRVLIVHSFYSSQQSSGENRAVEQQLAALERAGYEARLCAQYTDRRELSRLYPLAAAATVASGIGPSPLRDIRAAKPDIVHVHNCFPNFGRRWIRAVDVPTVATMHNFRPLCPAGTFFRDGQVCTRCLDRRSALPAIRHGCYRDSPLKTAPLAVSTRFGQDALLAGADRLVLLSAAARQLYERAGVASDRISVVPNFVPDDEDNGPGHGGEYWLYVGRLTAEKGVLELVRQWPAGHRLLVVGAGPLAADVRACASAGVELQGEVPPATVRELMRGACGFVFPSRWFEGFPLVYPEALSAGTPVLAWKPSTVAKAVALEGTGMVVAASLAEALSQAAELFPSLRSRCRETFERLYTEAAWLRMMNKIYSSVGDSEFP